MYNLFMGYTGPDETVNEVAVSASRFLEYTDSETQMRYRTLTPDAVREIKAYPCMFMREHCEGGAFVANIVNITASGRDYRITFERNADIGTIAAEDIERVALELGIDEFEFYRTHWAIKNIDLLRVLGENTYPGQLKNCRHRIFRKTNRLRKVRNSTSIRYLLCMGTMNMRKMMSSLMSNQRA